MTNDTSPDTIVLIHGLWVTSLSWEHWVDRYTARGYRVIARGWPGMEGSIEDLRHDPSALDGIRAADVIDHYASIIQELDRPPIIMGHSFGGAFTQVLLNRGLGAAGVAIDASAVKGIVLTVVHTSVIGEIVLLVGLATLCVVPIPTGAASGDRIERPVHAEKLPANRLTMSKSQV